MRVKLFRRGDLIRHTLWRDQIGLVVDVNPEQKSTTDHQIEVQWLETKDFYFAQKTLVTEDFVEKVI